MYQIWESVFWSVRRCSSGRGKNLFIGHFPRDRKRAQLPSCSSQHDSYQRNLQQGQPSGCYVRSVWAWIANRADVSSCDPGIRRVGDKGGKASASLKNLIIYSRVDIYIIYNIYTYIHWYYIEKSVREVKSVRRSVEKRVPRPRKEVASSK